MKEFVCKKSVSVYDDNFKMPQGTEICVLYADDCANVILPSGEVFHTGCDGLRVRVMKASNEKDCGTWCEGNYGGRLFI